MLEAKNNGIDQVKMKNVEWVERELECNVWNESKFNFKFPDENWKNEQVSPDYLCFCAVKPPLMMS